MADVRGKPGTTPARRTHRSASARPVAAAVWAGSAVALVWLLLDGAIGTAVAAAPWLLLASWLAYVGQWRPCLMVDASGFSLVNGLREHRIPFGAVEDIEVRYVVTVRAAGRKYVSWGAPTPPSAFGAGFDLARDVRSRPFSALPSNERLVRPESKTGRDAIVEAWVDARALGHGTGLPRQAQGVASSWNRPGILGGVVIGCWAAVSALSQALTR